MGGNSSRYVTPPWSPHPLCRDEIRGGQKPEIEDLTEAICFNRVVRQRDEALAEVGRLTQALAVAESREADLRRERNALVIAMAESVIAKEIADAG